MMTCKGATANIDNGTAPFSCALLLQVSQHAYYQGPCTPKWTAAVIDI